MTIKYLQIIKKLFIIYFTNYPYQLYYCANRHSNFGLVGVSYSLIYTQQIFWLGNISSIIFIYNLKNIELFYYNMAILIWSLSLYTICLSKSINLIKYIN
jgi:hypothetical protein